MASRTSGPHTFDSTFDAGQVDEALRRSVAAHESARELLGLIEQLGYALGDKDSFDGDGNLVHLRALDGPTLNYVGESRVGMLTTEFLAGLIRVALPKVHDANIDERLAKAVS
ncbi:hypothetical protein ACFVWR_18900 [Leifsonia sp. NPDC058292]|uniref:hypothetical protein n=1 Tax=Leifsonia sp. NPDC058292 TaxID=3346428 RepID=UPI0036DF6670